jgi:hypothetical protein
MNEFLIVLRGNLNDDIRRYFEKRGIEITFYDDFLPDVFIGTTSLAMEEVLTMQYVFDVKEPREGTLLENK